METSTVLSLVNAVVLLGTGITGVIGYKAINRRVTAQAELAEADSELTKTTAAAKIKELSMGLLEPLEAKIEEQKAQIDALTDEVKELREKVEQYIKDEAEYKRELADKDREIDDLRCKLANNKIERDNLRAEIEHLKERLRNAGINGE